MANDERQKGVYRAHRDRQRGLILNTARTLFAQRGIEQVTLAEIVTAAGLTRSTIYQYFSNKDDLVWAIYQDILERETEGLLQEMQDSSGTAYDKLAIYLTHLGNKLVDDPDEVRFYAQFDSLYARDSSADRMLALQAQSIPVSLRTFLSSLVQEGIADGSLRPDLNPEVTLPAFFNAAEAARRRLASMPGHIKAVYGQTPDRLFHETARILLQGIKAPEA